jgi:hypothetical protein
MLDQQLTTDLTIRPEYATLVADLYDMPNTDFFLKKLRKKAKKTFRKAGDVAKTAVNISPAGYVKKAVTGRDIVSPKHFKTKAGVKFTRATATPRQRIGQAALVATAGGVAAKKVGGLKKPMPLDKKIGAEVIPKIVKPKGGISEEWLPQPGDPTDVLGEKKQGIFGSLVGGAKEMLQNEVDKIKSNPDRVLAQLSNVISDKLQAKINQGLNSDSMRVQQAALDRLAAEKIKAEGGPNLAGVQMGGATMWILVAVVGLIVVAFIFKK